jgi:FkbM family methyltransferase
MSNGSDEANARLRKLFDEALSFYCGERLRKLKERPVNVIWGKLLFRLAQSLNRQIAAKVKTFWGQEMTVYFPDSVSYNIYHHGFYDEYVVCAFLDNLYPGMTILDIGAHLGYFTLLASELVGDQGQVHSFEPTLSTFQFLKINTTTRKNVTANNCAVFSREGALYLNDYGIGYFGLNSLYELHDTIDFLPKPKKIKVRGITVDKYVRENRLSPCFIKIDAESAESDIIRGMEETIARFNPSLLIERGYRDEFILAADSLISRGYMSYDCQTKKRINKVEDLKNISASCNVFFTTNKLP